MTSPLEALYGLLIFIFCKDLHATPLQITLLVSSKPLVALLSFYSNLIIKGAPERLKPLIFCCHVMGALPCFFFPFVENIWFFLLGFALFGMSMRAMIPAWSEILKINLSEAYRARIFSQGSITSYLVSTLVPLILAPWIDLHPHSWKWLFFLLAGLQVLSAALVLSIPIKREESFSDEAVDYSIDCWRSLILGPWNNCLQLLKSRPDFRNYQIVFMFGGAGLIVMQPVLPIFFKETLHLSYTQVSLATTLCKALAFACASPIWARGLNRVSLHIFNGLVTLFAAIYGLLIIAAGFQVGWLYVAYLLYGVMQAGSDLSWNLGGTLFAAERDSTLFTGVNVAMVGVRGAIVPFIGGLLFTYSNSLSVFVLGALLCCFGSLYSFFLFWQERTVRNLV